MVQCFFLHFQLSDYSPLATPDMIFPIFLNHRQSFLFPTAIANKFSFHYSSQFKGATRASQDLPPKSTALTTAQPYTALEGVLLSIY
jgi:hypothetical protein